MLEDQLNAFIAESQQLFALETASFATHRQFLTLTVAGVSILSLAAALLLGAILSWSLIRPVRRVDAALERIAGGDFETRITVPNRDEFGNLAENLNTTAARLAGAYSELETLNANLQVTVDTKVAELERLSRLKRYLSPQVAASIIAEAGDLDQPPSRKFLTMFFSDVRGFTAASERMEPEELVTEMNDYLTEMTGIVFSHDGTLDKYVGDAVMVFFGDPVHQPDHAARAVRMAFEMRERMNELQDHWRSTYRQSFEIGMGIATGWVTVGDIGSPVRSDYTVLGNEVNVAVAAVRSSLGGPDPGDRGNAQRGPRPGRCLGRGRRGAQGRRPRVPRLRGQPGVTASASRTECRTIGSATPLSVTGPISSNARPSEPSTASTTDCDTSISPGRA